MSQETANRWKLDYEIEQATDGRITASRLRKDVSVRSVPS